MAQPLTRSPWIIAFSSWLLPGFGYALLGQRARALTIGCTVLILFALGILIAGIRVIEVPGYSDAGEPIKVVGRRDRAGNVVELRSGQPDTQWIDADPNAVWILKSDPWHEILNKPWYIGQILAGPVTLICSKISIDGAKPSPENPNQSILPHSHVRVAEIGTLYTAVAGMLNLLAIIDAAHRAVKKGRA